ncbi:hypothetical protein [Ralstonia pseudosolanacearum]|uniref:hypothetical protein n=1 Tax=Ralstonia pseudosolanacearum TaxID=1310165 RepID=UPI003CE8B926
MHRYTYLVYYEGGPSKTTPLRSTKSEQDVVEALRAIPRHLEHYFDAGTAIEARDIETHAVRGPARSITIVTAQDEDTVDKCVARGLNGLDLYGDKIS